MTRRSSVWTGPNDLHGLFEDFCFHRFLAHHPLQFTDLLECIAQLRSWYRGFASTDYLEAAVLIKLAPREQLGAFDAITPSHHSEVLPWVKILANHGQFLL